MTRFSKLTREQVRAHIRERSEASESGCWIWTGAKLPRGYGCVGFHGYAHIESFKAFKGPVPDDREIHHKCESPSCVNPEHLEVVSHAENMVIGMRKACTAKLTIEKAREIRAICEADPHLNKTKLAKEYGVSRAVIRKVADGKGWKEYASVSL